MTKNARNKGTFVALAQKTACWMGHPFSFTAAVSIILIWILSGPVFGYSDTWQLVINTGTTIITFLMVFLIQNTQNRDSKAVQLKLDELIRAMDGAHTVLLDLEEMSEEELDAIRDKYETIARAARKRLKKGEQDTDMPEVVLDPDFELGKSSKKSRH